MFKIFHHRIVFQIKISILKFFLIFMAFNGSLFPKIKHYTNFLAIYKIIFNKVSNFKRYVILYIFKILKKYFA